MKALKLLPNSAPHSNWHSGYKKSFLSILSASTGRQRIAHKPYSKPKLDVVFDLKEEDEENKEEVIDGGSRKGVMTEEELWARLDELEKLEELQDEQDRYTNAVEVFFFSTEYMCLVTSIWQETEIVSWTNFLQVIR